MSEVRAVRGIPLRALAPNAVTALVLCFGLTGVRFAIGGEWDKALGAIVFAGVLDGMDGRIARLLKALSKFGAELDSLCDNIAFGTAPALVIFLWSLRDAPKFGWVAALALAVCCALRLARFNARIDADESYRIGLCDRLVDEADLESEVTALAATIAAQPPLAVQGAKRAVEAASRLPVAEGLVVEAEEQRVCLASDDMREAISAFVEQRTPDYKGK